jgi:hypothetical protein
MSVPAPLSISAALAAPPTIIPLSNTQHVINLKLTNTNYLFWRMQMKPYLIGQGVFSFVDDSTMCTSPHSDVSATSPAFCSGFSPAFLTWKQQDQLILSSLLSSLSTNVLHLVVDCPTSASVWSTLECALASPSNSRIMQLHGCLQDLRQSDDTVTAYLQKAKGVFDELAVAGRPISLTNFNLYVFRGLCNEFRDLVTSLSTKSDPLPYSELHSHLSTHEFLHRSSLHPLPMVAPLLPTPVQSPSAFTAQRSFFCFNGSSSSFQRSRGRRNGWRNMRSPTQYGAPAIRGHSSSFQQQQRGH